jgi:hypothetical protein
MLMPAFQQNSCTHLSHQEPDAGTRYDRSIFWLSNERRAWLEAETSTSLGRRGDLRLVCGTRYVAVGERCKRRQYVVIYIH